MDVTRRSLFPKGDLLFAEIAVSGDRLLEKGSYVQGSYANSPFTFLRNRA
jgi:hypothetical protein